MRCSRRPTVQRRSTPVWTEEVTRFADPFQRDHTPPAWVGPEAATLVVKGIEGAVTAKRVTYDLHRQMEGATLVSCSGFGEAIVDQM